MKKLSVFTAIAILSTSFMAKAAYVESFDYINIYCQSSDESVTVSASNKYRDPENAGMKINGHALEIVDHDTSEKTKMKYNGDLLKKEWSVNKVTAVTSDGRIRATLVYKAESGSKNGTEGSGTLTLIENGVSETRVDNLECSSGTDY